MRTLLVVSAVLTACGGSSAGDGPSLKIVHTARLEGEIEPCG